jgi:hypothetical protein
MIRIAAALLIATLGSSVSAQDRSSIRLEPGLWRVLIKSSQNGKPLPDKTESRCYSAAEFDDLAKTFATLFAEHDCTRSHAISGNTLTLSAACTSPAPQGGTLVVKGEGSYVFEDDKHFTSSVATTFAMPNQPSTAISLSKNAEYVSPCPN